MLSTPVKLGVIFTALLFTGSALMAQSRSGLQLNTGQGSAVTYDSQGRPIKKLSANDSLQRRDKYADSITIFYNYFDSTRNRTIDSSLNDFRVRYPLPWYYHTLGNFGTAAQSYFFDPLMKAGFDAGFHQYDIYRYTLENTKLYQTTRPYTELAYLLGSKGEQLINFTHTQNKKSNFNFSLEYNFNNSAGNLKNQNANESNFRFVSHYRGPGKRYEAMLIYFSNKTASSENGGLQDVTKLDSLALNDPYELDTRLGLAGPNAQLAGRNPFNTGVRTGNIYKDANIVLRHHYDLGQKDSIVTDSVTYKIFYPRLRIEHTFRFTGSSYNFYDLDVDTTRYLNYFNFSHPPDTISYKDSWKDMTNEFSLLSFPDKKNPSQFLKVGAAVQNLKGSFDTLGSVSLYNFSVLGEYRNRTRNQVWDVEGRAQLYLAGLNSGDYDALISLKRSFGKLGFLDLGFHNVNKSPAYIFNPRSTFPINNRTSYGKENIVRLFGVYENPRSAFKLSAEYFAVTNYLYFDSFFSAKQYAPLFNMLHVSLEKKLKLSRYWNWYPEIHLQQSTGGPPVHVPLLVMRHRIAFEGNFYTNLFLSTGFELIYHSPYKADNYSPFLGRYFVQNSETISSLPDINAFLHFRIKSFKGFVRAEGLNTLNIKNGFSFNKLNFMASQYPGVGLWIHVGIYWSFVN